MKKMCVACPFKDGENEQATIAQNLGCLPSSIDMIKTLEEHNVALSCHDNENIPCHGLSSAKDTSGAKLKTYTEWYNNG